MLTPGAWAGNLVDYRSVQAGFIESLRSLSVFDRLLGDNALRRVPLKTRITSVSSAVTGAQYGEQQLYRIGRMSLDGEQIEPVKTTAVIVLTDEVFRSTGTAGQTFLSAELRGAVSAATDLTFLNGIMLGAASSVSAGTTAANVYADISTLLDTVAAKGVAKLYLVMGPANARRLAVKLSTSGVQAFPNMTPSGGEIGGIPVLVTDQLPANTLLLIDASAIAGDSDIVTLDASEHADIQMSDTPTTDGTTPVVSLWQSNQRAIRAERWFGFQLIRAAGVATITAATY